LIQVGIIGYGTMGQVHAQALAEMAGVRLSAVADPDREKRAQAERAYNVPAVGDVKELLEREDLDLVDICTPTYLHEEVFKQAVQAEKHIFCEKPLARSLEEGKRIYNLTKDYGRKVGVAHVVRFFPEYVVMRESLLKGEIGRPSVVRTFRGGAQFPAGSRDWYGDFDLSGGVILDLVIHDIDYLRWLFGDVKRVYAKTTRGRTDARLEHALIILRFKNGVIAHVEGSWANFPGQFYTTVEIAGTSGLMTYDSRKGAPLLKIGLENGALGAGGTAVPENPSLKSPYRLELEDMITAIREDREPAVSVKEALATLEVALAALESVKTGEVITL